MTRVLFYFTTIILVFVFSLCAPVFCIAMEDSPSTEDLTFHVPSEQEGEPGEFITYLFQIRNQSTTGKTLTASAVSAQDWPLLTSEEEIVIPPGGQGLFAVSIWIPAAAFGGTEDSLTVHFTGPEFSSSYNLTTRVKVTTKFSLTFPERVTGQQGESLQIPVTLVNEGSTTRSFSLEAISERRWRVNWETAGITLAPGEKNTIHLQVNIPASVVAGAIDTLYLRVTAAATENAEASSKEDRLSVVVRKAYHPPMERENRIPVYSNFSFTLSPPLDPASYFTWATTLGLNGEIHPLLHYNLYLAGESEEELFSPSALFLGLTGEKWYLQAGRFSSYWPGLIAAPSTATNLYLQTRGVKPFSLWLGAGKDFISPAWLGGIIDLPEENLRWLLLVPIEKSRLHGVLETRYTPAATLQNWRWSYRHALGFDNNGLLNQGELSLQKLALDWRFTAALSGGKNFHFEYAPEEDESAYTGAYATSFGAANLNLEYYLSPGLTLEPGVTFRVATVGHKQRTSYTLQNRFSFPGAYLLIRRRQDLYGQTEKGAELGFSNEWQRREANSYQGTAALSLSRKNTSDTVRFYGRLRRWFYASSYLEAAYDQRWETTPTGFSTPFALGLRWYHLLYSNWEGYGSIYFHDDPTISSGYYSLQAATGYWFTPGTFLQLRATARWDEQETTLSKIELYLYYRDLFFLPAPWGGIEGRVFLDRNRNGRFDPDEPGIPGITVYLDGEAKAITGERGYFLLSRLKKGEYLLSFPQEETSGYLAPTAKRVSLQENRVVTVDIPALPPFDIKGLVFIDKNKNGLHDPGEPPAGRVQLLLYPADGGEPLATFVTGPDGSFFLPGLFPGSYRLEAVAETLPGFTTAEPVTLTVQDSAPLLLPFPLYEEEREIDFTFF
ncbi:MAG: hypothetical protein GX894_07615 [Clostridia bacterium]|nr:hypothetical protein [Clostridia bacterium]